MALSGTENVENAMSGVKKPKMDHVCPDETTLAMRIALIHPDAKMPVYGSEKAAGMDLHSCEDVTVPAKGKALVGTGLKMAIPAGYYGRVAPRSGLAWKNFLDVGAGVIDEDYRGELKVLLFNFNDQEFQVQKGDRIAQMVLEKCGHATLVQSEENELDQTVRGAGGFGSTGVSHF